MPRMLLCSLGGHAGLLLAVLLTNVVAPSLPVPRVYEVSLVELPGAGPKSWATSSVRKKGGRPAVTRQRAFQKWKKAVTTKNGLLKAAAARRQPTVRTPAKVSRQAERVSTPPRKPRTKSGMTLKRPRKPEAPPIKTQASKQLVNVARAQTTALAQLFSQSASADKVTRSAAKSIRNPAPARRRPQAATRQRGATDRATDVLASARGVTITAKVTRRGGWTKQSAGLSSGQRLSEDALNFPFMQYLKIVRRKVYEQFHVAGFDLSKGDVRKAVVYFQVNRDGQVMNLRMEKSSGSEEIDGSAFSAVQRAAPLPPLPEGYSAEVLSIHFGFEWVRQG